MNVTLNQIKAHNPCPDGWKKLLKRLDKTKADDEPLSLITVLDSNGLDDALWCLCALEGKDKEIRLYAVWCVREVQHLLTDQKNIDVALSDGYGWLVGRDDIWVSIKAIRARKESV